MSFKYTGDLCHDNEEWCKFWTGIDESLQNWCDQFNNFWLQHSKISITCTLMGCFWPRYIMLKLKTYRGVMFDGKQYWYKIWMKTDLSFPKLYEEFCKFSPEDIRKYEKLGLFLGAFIQSRKCVTLKFAGWLCVMIMKNDAKFEAKLTCQFKINMNNLLNVESSTWKS